jgi:hypothetical protein
MGGNVSAGRGGRQRAMIFLANFHDLGWKSPKKCLIVLAIVERWSR